MKIAFLDYPSVNFKEIKLSPDLLHSLKFGYSSCRTVTFKLKKQINIDESNFSTLNIVDPLVIICQNERCRILLT